MMSVDQGKTTSTINLSGFLRKTKAWFTLRKCLKDALSQWVILPWASTYRRHVKVWVRRGNEKHNSHRNISCLLSTQACFWVCRGFFVNRPTQSGSLKPYSVWVQVKHTHTHIIIHSVATSTMRCDCVCVCGLTRQAGITKVRLCKQFSEEDEKRAGVNEFLINQTRTLGLQGKV